MVLPAVLGVVKGVGSPGGGCGTDVGCTVATTAGVMIIV